MATQTMKQLSLGFALVLSLAAASAYAGEPTAADLAEAGAPDSIYNKDLPAPAPVNQATYTAQLGAAEAGNPHAFNSETGVASARPPANRIEAEAERRVAEAGNPHSVDSRQPPTFAMLQNLKASGGQGR